jgi:hypothetical protein
MGKLLRLRITARRAPLMAGEFRRAEPVVSPSRTGRGRGRIDGPNATQTIYSKGLVVVGEQRLQTGWLVASLCQHVENYRPR